MNGEPPPPLRTEELVASLQPREALREPGDVALELTFPVAAAAGRVPEADVEVVRRGDEFDLKVALRGLALGTHALPPAIEARQFEPEKEIRERQQDYPEFDGYLPDHLALRPLPRRVPRELDVPRRIATAPIPDRPQDVHEATTVFPPENRYIFQDTTFPWCTTGRVDTPGGLASGTMVGPRHMLTCSHTIQWNADGTAGWVKFTPGYFDGSAPFGVAWGTWVYWEELKVFGPLISRSEGQHDYVCVVLNTRIGEELTGWMGSRSWSDDWDGEPYWRHIGYPADLAGGERPSYQADIALDGSFWDREVHTRIFHQGDVWLGQSGGPFFAWWEGESWPRIVADQSGQSSDENSASGGAHMIDCIIRARNDFP